MEGNPSEELWSEFNLVESKFLDISARYGESKKELSKLCKNNNAQIDKLREEIKQLTDPENVLLAFMIDEEKLADDGVILPCFYCVEEHDQRIANLEVEIRSLIDEIKASSIKHNKLKVSFQESLHEYGVVSDKVQRAKADGLDIAANKCNFDVILEQDYTLAERAHETVRNLFRNIFNRKN